ncbi:2-oxo-4-hydroxy-4-carboxy-5-ureidoimidazoline decarboxylase [Radiobacillus sp. PE A8.2]|uniref:2-oxo-4-hydroxy-4-carboxy-5-ureidoimidazoline decarboxylase n=1 Tax=Radiobacillus sp. PE A8.2 TaxID=3380349 RepID=UPI00388CEE99
MVLSMDDLNQLDKDQFVHELGDVFEHSPWVAKKAVAFRTFSSLQALHQRMVEIVNNAPFEEQLELIRAHPNLGEKIEMSDDSTKEQQGAGLQNLTVEEYNSFQSLNKAYMEKFGFPFIFAVKGKNKHDIHDAMKKRVNHTEEEEFETALSEIYKIALFRLQAKIAEDDVRGV